MPMQTKVTVMPLKWMKKSAIDSYFMSWKGMRYENEDNDTFSLNKWCIVNGRGDYVFGSHFLWCRLSGWFISICKKDLKLLTFIEFHFAHTHIHTLKCVKTLTFIVSWHTLAVFIFQIWNGKTGLTYNDCIFGVRLMRLKCFNCSVCAIEFDEFK